MGRPRFECSLHLFVDVWWGQNVIRATRFLISGRVKNQFGWMRGGDLVS